MDQDEPIPNPFKCQLPLDLEVALKSNSAIPPKTVNRVAKYVSHKMFGYSRKVNKKERERVANEMVQKYPVLGTKVSTYTYVHTQVHNIQHYFYRVHI